ncbi:ABC transporter substrate-binding protein [Patiriisocius marinus]|uniref:Iron ABC transporter n=1 Tax=Patiriisocius marinus TaxID=1397112 RepID=A0A5J4IYD1_9FLAO|nr:helical backbone metal receptor [Patiriisocius marinus]GER59994.1 iron ABC transporter [Patiriisocius marinus]
MIYKDQLNRTISLNATPKRIVSLVPSQTELLVSLGLEEFVVGVTKFCVHPNSLRKEKIVVGGTKTIHLEKIAALQPDIIICNKEENTKDIVDCCSQISSVWVSDIVSLEDNNEMILLLGEIFDKKDESTRLVDEINRECVDYISFVKDQPVVDVAYCIWKNPYMVAGGDTFIDSLLRMARFNNIFYEKEGRYPVVDISELSAAKLILLSSEPYPFKSKEVQELKNELHCEVRLVDGEYFSWYGSRIKNAFKYFRTLRD